MDLKRIKEQQALTILQGLERWVRAKPGRSVVLKVRLDKWVCVQSVERINGQEVVEEHGGLDVADAMAQAVTAMLCSSVVTSVRHNDSCVCNDCMPPRRRVGR